MSALTTAVDFLGMLECGAKYISCHSLPRKSQHQFAQEEVFFWFSSRFLLSVEVWMCEPLRKEKTEGRKRNAAPAFKLSWTMDGLPFFFTSLFPSEIAIHRQRRRDSGNVTRQAESFAPLRQSIALLTFQAERKALSLVHRVAVVFVTCSYVPLRNKQGQQLTLVTSRL